MSGTVAHELSVKINKIGHETIIKYLISRNWLYQFHSNKRHKPVYKNRK